ncbi:hypothetical protein Tsubulata_015455 [Turnera subulata]|uniref:DUF4283 domain-containing protein n=1 Tax=Turnera subulata TaxID=218843 RepID=A0A9Q0FB30_9ROSI|nr:hypothetical protein Tsubulata_015455 [Turnera subulata]
MDSEKRSEPENPDTGQAPQPVPLDESSRSAKKSRPNGDEVLPQANEDLSKAAASDPIVTECAGGAEESLPQAEPSAGPTLNTHVVPPPWSFRDVVSEPADLWDLEDDVEYEDGDIVYVDGEFGMGIELSETFKSRLDKQWQNSVIVKLLGRTIGYKALCGRIQTLWNPRGKFRVIDLLNNYFIVRFELHTDCIHALCDGPWQVYGSALTVQPWSSHFRAAEDRIARAVVWVRFPDLNPSRYHPRILGAMGILVGRTVKIDIKTHNAKLGQYAKSKVPAAGGVPSTSAGPSHSVPAPAGRTSGEYGEWMIVPRSSGRWTRKNPPPTSQANVSASTQADVNPKIQGSRYTVLGDDDTAGQQESASTATTVGGNLKGMNIIDSPMEPLDSDFPALARPVPKVRLGPVVEKNKKPGKPKNKKTTKSSSVDVLEASLNTGAQPTSSTMPQAHLMHPNSEPKVSPPLIPHSMVQLPPSTHSIIVSGIDKAPTVPSTSTPSTSLSPSPSSIPRATDGEVYSRLPDLNPSSALAYLPSVKSSGVGHSDGVGFSLKKPVLQTVGSRKTKGTAPPPPVGSSPSTVMSSDVVVSDVHELPSSQ